VDALVRTGATTATVLDVARAVEPVAVITGGSYGVGRELARVLAGRGYAVVVVYIDDQGAAEAIVDEILGSGGTALAIRADVSDELDVERVFRETRTAFGAIDVIVHTEFPASLDLLGGHREEPE
jgi:3-oxoacyl-[acyl-carrier protein] reductase